MSATDTTGKRITAAVRQTGYRRLILGFDHHEESRTVLAIAEQVAVTAQLELTGIFVEDSELFELAALPFSTEFLIKTRRRQSFDLQCVERELRTHILASQAALQQMARRAHRAFSFRTVRGRLLRALMQEASAGDLIMLRRADKPWHTTAIVGGHSVHAPVLQVLPPAVDEAAPLVALGQQIAQELGRPLIRLTASTAEIVETTAREVGAALIILPFELLSEKPWQEELELFADRVPSTVLIAGIPAQGGSDSDMSKDHSPA
ncbi:MAG TPA: hypothetical protein DCF61_04385 [Alphaproteobacteria bacterium]|nr:hypothetical protein [Alphaproteobacteria bacterium]